MRLSANIIAHPGKKARTLEKSSFFIHNFVIALHCVNMRSGEICPEGTLFRIKEHLDDYSQQSWYAVRRTVAVPARGSAIPARQLFNLPVLFHRQIHLGHWRKPCPSKYMDNSTPDAMFSTHIVQIYNIIR